MIKYDGKVVSKSWYYYGCNFDTWDNMTYPEAIKDRYDRVEKMYFELERKSLDQSQKMTEEDKLRLFKVKNAFDDCKQILNERTELI